MVKFNYLLNALEGEPKESIKKFQVSKGNYSKAIEFLNNKYNNRENLVNHLIEKLDNCALRSPSIKDRRSLLEHLQAIIAQLQEKGEEVNSSWLGKKILLKFPDPTKRKVIIKKQDLASTIPFTMQYLLKCIDDVICTEEICMMFSEKKSSTETRFTSLQKPPQYTTARCMYCKGNHPANKCSKFPTAKERSTYLREHKLCLICASPYHITSQCKGRACFICNGAHHTSCCFRKEEKPIQRNCSPNSKNPKNQENTRLPRRANKNLPTRVGSNIVTTSKIAGKVDEASIPSETAILQSLSAAQSNQQYSPCLPVGEVTVIDFATKSPRTAHVLLDTGAEGSFIDSSLAEELHLPAFEEKQILLHTFGSDTTTEVKCKKVRLDMYDSEGTIYNLELLMHNVLTRELKAPQLPAGDLEFMKSMNILMVGQNQEKTIKPTILLGCDNLWTFIRNDIPSIPLPSGLHVLPTKLGYLLSGKINPQEQSVLQVTEQKPEEFNQWDKYFSMDSTQTYTISSSEMVTTEEEKERWDQFWSLDAAGTEEYTKSEKENKALIDTKVWERFNHTIQQREDGYYVRLPWIENHPHLPDNRALAYKRLVNVWASISKEGELLEQYNNVFQDQRSQGIIEDVDERILTKNQIHYIPYQPVVTPQKTTTKLRIVFDASAHYKGCRSLNDVLHRGPIMLPSLFGTLLRARVGKIAIISDVEKAFLQIRLQEQDRDATRCLWLCNYKLPPAQDNVRTYRFTKVTFGLKSSPFLLAGTIHHHLSRYKDEIPFVEEVGNNLYVDNLISTTDTVEEGLTYYQKAKQVFKDLNMNLRELSTNCAQLEGAIQESDRASQQVPKILGLTWDTLRGTIRVTCNVSATPIVTKRTITSALASIYDPMGWLVPMLFPIKRFLQELWRNEYAWDTVLPTSKQSTGTQSSRA